MTAELEGGEWSAARPGRILPPGKNRYPLYRRLGGPQGQSGRAEKFVPTGIRSRTVQPVVSRYTDWATRPTLHLLVIRKIPHPGFEYEVYLHTHTYSGLRPVSLLHLQLGNQRNAVQVGNFPHSTASTIVYPTAGRTYKRYCKQQSLINWRSNVSCPFCISYIFGTVRRLSDCTAFLCFLPFFINSLFAVCTTQLYIQNLSSWPYTLTLIPRTPTAAFTDWFL